MRYLTLAEALAIAKAVTGIDAAILSRAARLELLDSALHAPKLDSARSGSIPSSWTRQRSSSYASRGTIRCRAATSAWLGKH